jgi:pyruvate/2-oxoglutarate/acetoin dehydrogenase E1 component
MPELTYAQAVNAALREEMQRDPRITLLGMDIGKYGGVFGVTRGLYDEFGPNRVRDCPLNEASIVGFGVGLAISGKPAVTELEFMDFATYAMDQITNQAAKLRYIWGGQVSVPLVVRMPIVAELGFGSQHSQSLEAWFMHTPGLKVVIPSTAYDAKGLMKTALRDGNPVVFIENVRLYATKSQVPDEEYLIPFGQADIKREGDHVTMVAISAMVHDALVAADELARYGIMAEVIDPRTLSPLDADTIVASVEKTGRLIVAHKAYKTGGVGAEIAQTVMERAFDSLDAPIIRVAAQDVPIPASQALEAATFPGIPELVMAARQLCGR